MKNQISDYGKMINRENKKNLDLKHIERRGYPGWKVDLFSHFRRLGIGKQLTDQNEINLRPFYT